MSEKTVTGGEVTHPKEKPAEAQTEAKAPEAAKAEEPKTTVLKFFSSNRPLKETDKLPAQAKVIVEVLKEVSEGKKEGIERKDLVAALEGKIVTKQPVERILAFYQKRLVTDGLVKVVEREVKVEAAPKAA